MRVLLTGSTGRLGGAFVSLWQNHPDYRLRTLPRAKADLARPDELSAVLEQEEFDVLLNPAAISGLEQCADNPDLAKAVNVDSPRVMAAVCAAKGAKLVHFSTDYVFAGERAERKTEASPTAAVNCYGETKLAGEQAVLEACPDAIVGRVSWLFGPAPENRPTHFDQVLERAMAGVQQSLIDDKYSVPTYTHDIVAWVDCLLRAGAAGIYHLCNAGEPESWFSYAKKIVELARQLGYAVDADTLVASSIEDAVFFREKRPLHTAMLPQRLQNEGIACPRHWLAAAEDYLKIR